MHVGQMHMGQLHVGLVRASACGVAGWAAGGRAADDANLNAALVGVEPAVILPRLRAVRILHRRHEHRGRHHELRARGCLAHRARAEHPLLEKQAALLKQAGLGRRLLPLLRRTLLRVEALLVALLLAPDGGAWRVGLCGLS